ncbi:MAG TPA: NAD(P)/FAD-dependent oxidoreductase, partial [Rubrivivax sp.]|nr:NAD(P)/FAD-dependent oxidoreductase [Rubrivivax sp.]
MTLETLDVLIVGAGISGLSAAWHLQTHSPDRRFAILEARHTLGGTWSLFRYPGFRSDSDMYTLGFHFQPWRKRSAIARGPEILQYLHETAREHGLERHIRYGTRVLGADWNPRDARWELQALRTAPDGTEERLVFWCNFLFVCGGYYRYDRGYQPAFAGMTSFAGIHVHAQQWPQGLDCRGKRVVVIGSGATAATLVPALAEQGAQVVLLQRTPSYYFIVPGLDRLALLMRRLLPERWAYWLTRKKNVALGAFLFSRSRSNPEFVRGFLLGQVAKALPQSYDLRSNFAPPYGPWEQRLCLVPDGDLFKAISDGRAEVVTDHIQRFTEQGLQLESGRVLQADVIVSATGLELQMLGGVKICLDGVPVDTADLVVYKGVMYGGIPNLAATFGYLAASWTLKADVTSQYVCRLLNHMREVGATVATPDLPPIGAELRPFADFSSGYFRRAAHLLPRQGSEEPWKLLDRYADDRKRLLRAPLDDGVLAFTSAPSS